MVKSCFAIQYSTRCRLCQALPLNDGRANIERVQTQPKRASARGAYLLRGSAATNPLNLNWIMPAKGSERKGHQVAAPGAGGRPFLCGEVNVWR